MMSDQRRSAERVEVSSRAGWRAWLMSNHTCSSGIWLAPRKPGSGWSRINKQRVEKVVAAGLTTPAGKAKIEEARRDGSWDTLNAVDDLVIPPDLADALDGQPSARHHFEAFPRSIRRGILEWIANAKTPATRARRVAESARLPSQNIRANQWRQ